MKLRNKIVIKILKFPLCCRLPILLVASVFIVQKYGENLTQAVTILEKFYCSNFHYSHIDHKNCSRSTRSEIENIFLICQMDGKNVETEHKNLILKIKRFAVFKNHKTLLSACGI
jgi:hypothetical protein